MNPQVAHWHANKTRQASQRAPDGTVLRIEEKSEEEMERLILQSTEQGDLVFDPFAGTGTTGVACAKLGRRFIGYVNSFTNVTLDITLGSFRSFERDPVVWQTAQLRLKHAYEQVDGDRLVMKSRAPKDAENFATWEWDVDVKTQETKERNAWIRLRKLRGDVFELPTKVAIMSTNIVG